MKKKPLDSALIEAYTTDIISCIESIYNLKTKDELRFYLNEFECDAKRALQESLDISDESIKYIDSASDVSLSNLGLDDLDEDYQLICNIAKALHILLWIKEYNHLDCLSDNINIDEFKDMILDLKNYIKSYRYLEIEKNNKILKNKQSKSKPAKRSVVLFKLVSDIVKENPKLQNKGIWSQLENGIGSEKKYELLSDKSKHRIYIDKRFKSKDVTGKFIDEDTKTGRKRDMTFSTMTSYVKEIKANISDS